MLRRVSKELAPYMSWALERDKISYTVRDMGNYMEFLTDGLPSRQFTNLYEDAECEKERLESFTPEIPVLSYRAAMNTVRMKKILEFYGTDCFVVRKKDHTKYLRTVKDI